MGVKKNQDFDNTESMPAESLEEPPPENPLLPMQ